LEKETSTPLLATVLDHWTESDFFLYMLLNLYAINNLKQQLQMNIFLKILMWTFLCWSFLYQEWKSSYDAPTDTTFLSCDIKSYQLLQAFWLNLVFIKYPKVNVSQFSYFWHYSGERHGVNKQTNNKNLCSWLWHKKATSTRSSLNAD
jgi:hypothetical protein